MRQEPANEAALQVYIDRDRDEDKHVDIEE